MVFPAHFLSQEVCKCWSTPTIFSAALKVCMAVTVILTMLNGVTAGGSS